MNSLIFHAKLRPTIVQAAQVLPDMIQMQVFSQGHYINTPKDRHLVMVGGLECLGDPLSYAGGSFVS